MPRNIFEVKVGSTGVRRRIRRISNSIFSQVLMKEIGEYGRTMIKVRTARGVDIRGRRFAPYTPKYKIFRKEKGRPTNIVNLNFTGSMMSSIQYAATDKRVRLFILNTTDDSGARNPVKAFGLNRKRNFFGLSQQDKEYILNLVRQRIRRSSRGR